MKGAYDLHTYWDKCLKQYKDLRAPLNGKDWLYLNTIVDKLMSDYPQTFFGEKVNETSIFKWAKESRQVAKNNAYAGIIENGAPSEAYIANGIIVV